MPRYLIKVGGNADIYITRDILINADTEEEAIAAAENGEGTVHHESIDHINSPPDPWQVIEVQDAPNI